MENEHQLVLAIDRDLDIHDMPEFRLWAPDIEQFLDGVHRLVAVAAKVNGHGGDPFIKMVMSLFFDAKLAEQIGIVEARYGREVVDILLEGKLRTSLLINSLGGSGFCMRGYLEIIDFIRARGGEVSAYISEDAASAAANILLEADKRYSLRRSEFLWHYGGINEDLDPVASYDDVAEEVKVGTLREIIEVFRNKIVPKIVGAVPDPDKREVVAAFFESHYNCSDFFFRAEVLYDLGILHEIYDNVAGLRARFEEVTGIDALSDQIIADFFSEMRDIPE